MDKKLRTQLVSKLIGVGGFDLTYTPQNRAWFVGAVLDAVAVTTADKDIEAKARGIIASANARVKADRGFAVGVTLDPKTAAIERKNVAQRVETIYGVIAQNIDLAETSFDPLRRFIVKRRYRGVVRMVFHVNPNANGFMRYPQECPAWGDMRLNETARPHWIAVDPKSTVPLRTEDQADPEAAADAIFINAFPDPCRGNLLDCGNGTGCVLMDTLFEADDPEKLFKAVKARSPRHLLVINPTLRLGTDPHFLFDKDTEPKRLFSQQVVAEKDLQIGDHVYLVNHGLYPNVAPNGVWTGEHALVTQCGNRKPADGKGFLYNGHGLDNPTTVEALYDELVKYLQSYLHRAYKIAELYLSFRKRPAAIPEAEREFKVLTFKPDGEPEATVHAHRLLKARIQFNDYTKPPKGGNTATLIDGGKDMPLVIFEIPDRKEIRIAPPTVGNTIEKQQKRMHKMTILVRTGNPTPGGSLYDKALWQVPFKDTETLQQNFFPLFGGPNGAFKLLARSDMPKNKFGRRKASDNGAEVTRPTTDSASTYVQFLKTIGAIA